MFDFLSPEDVGLTSIPEPSLDLAKWAVAEGGQVGADGHASLIFASRDHLFWFTLFTDGSAGDRRSQRSSSTSPNDRSQPPVVPRHPDRHLARRSR